MMIHKKHEHTKISLRWWLIVIIIACWILPIAIVGGAMSSYITNNINQQISETITLSGENAARLASGQIDLVVSASRYASYNNTIKDAYTQYMKTRDDMRLYDSVFTFLSEQYKYDEKLLFCGLFFLSNPDNIYYTYNEINNSTYNSVRDYKQSAHEVVKRASETLGTGVAFINVQGRVYLARNLINSDFKPYGVLVVQLNLDNIFAGMQSIAWENAATVWLNGTPVVLDGEQLNPDALNITFPPNGQTFRSTAGGSYLYGSRLTQTAELSYLISIDNSVLMEEMKHFQKILVWLVLSVLPFLAIVVYFFSRNVTHPINRLIAVAKEIERENYGITVDDRLYNAEFSYLTDAFNSMSYKLQYQFNRIYKEELALRDARIMALQSQINPHFLNNTLEIINWEARLIHSVKITRMIEALSSMLGAATDRKGKPVVHLSEELIYVDSYLYIIGVRFGKRLTVTKEIDASLLDLYVPRLIMQPIIENAVEHGVAPQQKGEIIIRVYKENDSLILETENSGALTEEDKERIDLLLSDSYEPSGESSLSLGIRNVHQRLRIIYGENSRLSVVINKAGYTVFRIIIAIDPSKQ